MDQKLVDGFRSMYVSSAEAVAAFKALGQAIPGNDTRPIEVQREELLAIREREIMQNRLATAMVTGKPVKKMKYAERLKLRMKINQQLKD